ncbi:MAG: hypothetical protein P8182_10770 [Deltaproteobacteria bacterium]
MTIHNAEIKRDRAVPEPSEKQARNASPSDAVRDLQTLAASEVAAEQTLAVTVETRLNEIYPCRVAKAEDGLFTVDVEAPLIQEGRLVEEYNRVAKEMAGVKGVRVHILPSSIWGWG